MKDYRPYDQALALAHNLLDLLRPACERIEIAGSLRRQRDMIGDLELVAIQQYKEEKNLFGEVIDRQQLIDDVICDNITPGRFSHCKLNGLRHKSFRFQGFPVDLFLVDANTWGALFTIRTGNAIFSHWSVSQRRMGGGLPDHLYIQDGRVHNRNTGFALTTPEEGDVLDLLGLPADLPPSHQIRNARDWADIKQLLATIPGGAR